MGYAVNKCDNYWKIIKNESETYYEVYKRVNTIYCKQICTVCQICTRIHMFTLVHFIKRKRQYANTFIIIIISKSNDSRDSSVRCSRVPELNNLNAFLDVLSQKCNEPLNTKNNQLNKIKSLLAQLSVCNYEIRDEDVK